MISRSWSMAIGSFAAGVFIDLDHFIDYWREHPYRLDLPHFFSTCNEVRLEKVYLWLHSLEMLPLLGLLVFFTRSGLLAGILLGLSQHLLLDMIGNCGKPAAYLFFYRRYKKFMTGDILYVPMNSQKVQE